MQVIKSTFIYNTANEVKDNMLNSVKIALKNVINTTEFMHVLKHHSCINTTQLHLKPL